MIDVVIDMIAILVQIEKEGVSQIDRLNGHLLTNKTVDDAYQAIPYVENPEQQKSVIEKICRV